MDTVYISNMPETNYFLGISLNIVASILLPMFIFSLGYLIKWFSGKLIENKRLKTLESYIYLQLGLLLQDVKTATNNLNEFIVKLKERKQQHYMVSRQIAFHASNILKITHSDLYKIFIQRKKGEEMANIRVFDNMDRAVHNVYESFISFEKHFLEMISFLKIYQQDWATNIEKIYRILERIAVFNQQRRISKAKDPLAASLDNWFFNLQQTKNNDLFFIIDNYLDLLINICNNYSNDPRILDISEGIIGCRTAYNNIVSIKNLYINLFNHYFKNYQTATEVIPTGIKRFKKLENKWYI